MPIKVNARHWQHVLISCWNVSNSSIKTSSSSSSSSNSPVDRRKLSLITPCWQNPMRLKQSGSLTAGGKPKLQTTSLIKRGKTFAGSAVNAEHSVHRRNSPISGSTPATRHCCIKVTESSTIRLLLTSLWVPVGIEAFVCELDTLLGKGNRSKVRSSNFSACFLFRAI